MKTEISANEPIPHFWVSILPLRNENHERRDRSRLLTLGFYPTFEEWKPPLKVLALQISTGFLSYLWGMKTFVSPFYSSFLSSVSILPLRNENFLTSSKSYQSLPFLSYLWGMKTRTNSPQPWYRLGFYPTFEEWKRTYFGIQIFLSYRFYPTFEEWKPAFALLTTWVVAVSILPLRNENRSIFWSLISASSFYPTFEEWKQQSRTY